MRINKLGKNIGYFANSSRTFFYIHCKSSRTKLGTHLTNFFLLGDGKEVGVGDEDVEEGDEVANAHSSGRQIMFGKNLVVILHVRLQALHELCCRLVEASTKLGL